MGITPGVPAPGEVRAVDPGHRSPPQATEVAVIIRRSNGEQRQSLPYLPVPGTRITSPCRLLDEAWSLVVVSPVVATGATSWLLPLR